MVEAMIYRIRIDCPWHDLPGYFGPWRSVYTRWRRWNLSGVWAQVLDTLAADARGTLRPLDATHIKVHQDAANPPGGQSGQSIGRTKGGLNTKLTAPVDTQGRALQLTLAPGNRADVKAAEQICPRRSASTSGADGVRPIDCDRPRRPKPGLPTPNHLEP